MCKHSTEQVVVCWVGLSCCNPLVRKGRRRRLADRLRSNRLHRFVKSRNSVVEEVMVLGLKSMEVVLMEMDVLF